MYNKDFYDFDTIRKIMQTEEHKGHLKNWTYSDFVLQKSRELKEKRAQIKDKPKSEREELLQELKDLQTEYDTLKTAEQQKMSDEVVGGKCELKAHQIKVKNHLAYTTKDVHSFVVSRIITQELKTKYKIIPADRNKIIEQLYGLLDNQMSKVIIRCDVRNFYESIPQSGLLSLLKDDGLLSGKSYKYLKKFLYQYNSLANNTEAIGLPRGLSFSAYLSEIYMKSIDNSIMNIDGIYFYKRYVDDIIIVANPKKNNVDEYWKCINECFDNTNLRLHEKSDKLFKCYFESSATNIHFDYLGYGFYFTNGNLSIKISQNRIQKYKDLIDILFETYSKCAQCKTYKKTKNDKDKRTDALKELMERLKILTGNGLLSGRKNYVASGVYFSNKFITNTSQLKELDNYLSEHIDNPNYFCPPSNLFNFNGENQYDIIVAGIKKKLHTFSFEFGFTHPTLNKNSKFSLILHKLHKLYYLHHE